MRAGLLEAMVRGDRSIWAIVAALWLITAGLVVAQRGGGARLGYLRIVALLSLASATSMVGLTLATALAVPRIVWKTSDGGDLVEKSGDTWRRLRGPAVQILVGGVPDVAIPTIDASGAWVLSGLLSGKPAPGLPPAAATAPELGTPRLCSTTSERCRAWPSAWPDPARSPAFDDFTWAKDGASAAFAYDVESGLYLRDVGGLEREGRALELVGRVTNDAPREGATALFVLRRIQGGRLAGMRVVAIPGRAPGTQEYRVQRADVSLSAGPWVLRFVARPVLVACALALPVLLLAYLFAPTWLAARLRQRAVRRELARSLVLVPVLGGARDRVDLATVIDDAEIGDATLTRGTVVSAALGADDGRPVESRAWFELPALSTSEPAPGSAPAPVGEREANADANPARRLGLLVPADALPFRRAARAWLSPYAYAIAILATGLAAAAPGLVAVVALLSTR